MRGILATEPTLQRTASAHRPTVPCQTALVGPCVPMALRALCSRPCRILSPLSGHHRSRQHRGTHAVRRIRIYDLAPQPRRADLPHVGLLFQTVVSAALPRTAPSHPLPRAHHTQAQTQPRAVPSSPSAARSCWRSRLQTTLEGHKQDTKRFCGNVHPFVLETPKGYQKRTDRCVFRSFGGCAARRECLLAFYCADQRIFRGKNSAKWSFDAGFLRGFVLNPVEPHSGNKKKLENLW